MPSPHDEAIKRMIRKFPEGTKVTFDNRDATVKRVDERGVDIVFDSDEEGKKGEGEPKFVDHGSDNFEKLKVRGWKFGYSGGKRTKRGGKKSRRKTNRKKTNKRKTNRRRTSKK